jgi:zeaxanthin glucosyltransferase
MQIVPRALNQVPTRQISPSGCQICERSTIYETGVICPNLPGHLNPMTALARQLQARNHDVVFLYSSSASGLPCVPGPEKDDIHETIAEVSKLQGEEAFKFGNSWLMTQTERILKSLPATVQANGVDAL